MKSLPPSGSGFLGEVGRPLSLAHVPKAFPVCVQLTQDWGQRPPRPHGDVLKTGTVHTLSHLMSQKCPS